MHIFTHGGRLCVRTYTGGKITAEPIETEAGDVLRWFWYNIPANEKPINKRRQMITKQQAEQIGEQWKQYSDKIRTQAEPLTHRQLARLLALWVRYCEALNNKTESEA